MNLSPLMGFLNPDNVNRMADLAVQLSTLAARSMAKNEKDVAETVEEPREISLGAPPSQILGQAVSDVTTQSRLSLLKAFAPLEQGNLPSTPPSTTTTEAPKLFPDFGGGFGMPRGDNPLAIKPINSMRSEPKFDLFSPDVRHFPATQSGVPTHAEKTAVVFPSSDLKSVGDTVELPRPVISKPYSALDQNPFVRLASTFLGGGTRQGDSLGSGNSISSPSANPEPLDFGGIRDFLPGANNNFGLKKGPGCLPFLSEFMQAAYGDCQKVADEKAFDAWGDELKSAILTGQIDLLKASQETCKRGAERQQCGALRKAISNCDILESLQIGAQLQRAMKRCEEVSGLVDQENENKDDYNSVDKETNKNESGNGYFRLFSDSSAVLTASYRNVLLPLRIAPTTTTSTTTALTQNLVTVNSTASSNTTALNQHVGLRETIATELGHLRDNYQVMRKDFDVWMSTPYHRNVVIPSMIGVLSAIVAVAIYQIVKAAIRSCARRFRRYRLSRLTCEIDGDKKRMLPKRGDSDDEEDI
ncbi:unnamed protein product [Cylicocyclus nassatus]|uniref:Uncharacterized protein n=1 Tax=Cylicocyclus nassatus TaxID=53992 RepID=A0AA36DMJ7_CYLNA|nr:unnamed protein product [Cylicocyclus nassatus]